MFPHLYPVQWPDTLSPSPTGTDTSTLSDLHICTCSQTIQIKLMSVSEIPTVHIYAHLSPDLSKPHNPPPSPDPIQRTCPRPPLCGCQCWSVEHKLLCGEVIGGHSLQSTHICTCRQTILTQHREPTQYKGSFT